MNQSLMIFDRIQPADTPDYEFATVDPQLRPELQVASGRKPIGVDSIRYECQFLHRYANCILQPHIEVVGHSNVFPCPECQEPSSHVPAIGLSIQVRHVTAVLSVDESGVW